MRTGRWSRDRLVERSSWSRNPEQARATAVGIEVASLRPTEGSVGMTFTHERRNR
jgi:hypothetical protein